MVHWKEVPVALNVSAFGACGGVWSGSADPIARVAGASPRPLISFSVQCNSALEFAEPLDASDPHLIRWTKLERNGTFPRIAKPRGTGGFRDPSQPWRGADGVWRILAACNGGACQWTSPDLLSWTHAGYAAGTGRGSTWEMPDLFSIGGAGGQASALTVFKTGMENGTDYWATGKYDEGANKFVTGRGSLDPSVMGGSRRQLFDGGKWYASKSWVASDGRRVIIGCVDEVGGPLKEWMGVQSVPRTVASDPRHPGRILIWPIAELDALRIGKPATVSARALPPASVAVATSAAGIPVEGAQLDLRASFTGWATASGGACEFGLGVLGGLANATVSIPSGADNVKWATLRLQTPTSPPGGVLAEFPLALSDDHLALRVLVDRSVIEVFAHDGRAVATHRVYKNDVDVGSTVLLLNRGTNGVTLAGLDAFAMGSRA